MSPRVNDLTSLRMEAVDCGMEESIVRSFPERTLNDLRNLFLFSNPYQGVLHLLRDAIFIVLDPLPNPIPLLNVTK